MKKIMLLAVATAAFASIAATALAAPAIPVGATAPPGMGGVCTDCHTYITPTTAPAPAPAPKPVVVPVATTFVRVWGSKRAVDAFAHRAKGVLSMAFAGRATRRGVFAVKTANCSAFKAAAKVPFTNNVDTFARTRTRNLMVTLGYALPVAK
jgi:hypothetical protein